MLESCDAKYHVIWKKNVSRALPSIRSFVDELVS